VAEVAEVMPEEVSITMLPPEAILGLRVPLVEHLERAMAGDRTTKHRGAPIETPQDVLGQSVAGKTQIWLIHEGNEILGVATTIIVQHPRQRMARIIYIAGHDFKRWHARFLDTIEMFARQRDCAALEWFLGRRGWERLLGRDGAEKVGSLYRKTLEA